ncbi:hypothetical protein AB0L40_23250 [Patulibacter sp. NPDC049589]|uniref:hypothetical protein n=1 Tax=Patulibacter sp. NPDC049589 TaxID=3154731 RepID=UPI0034139EEE
MLASIARFNGFTVTIALRDEGGDRSITGTPLEVLNALEAVTDDAAVLGLTSVLGPSR